jgi:hypothetical protein
LYTRFKEGANKKLEDENIQSGFLLVKSFLKEDRRFQ